MQEQRSAGIAADYIEKLGYEVTRGVGAAGTVSYRPGVILSAGDSLQVTLFGRAAVDAQRGVGVAVCAVGRGRKPGRCRMNMAIASILLTMPAGKRQE